ncbi:MAG: adenine deaminase [Candidatus Adiutrix sp.]|jgi:adenine deaminase|nr:adenine deaminase [Candidatus Adiutrix sp.]
MRAKNLERLIDVAQKREAAELVIKNAKFFNVFTGRFVDGDVAVDGGYIAGTGRYEGLNEFDAAGAYLTPGFFDGHVHIESGMASPGEFARILAACGTTTIIADPHEIANVAGAAGIEYILEATEAAPVNVYVMLPSCVPATPLERGGAKLDAADLARFMDHPRVLGLGEMMNFPGVLSKDPEVMAKLRLAGGRRIDGHAPGLSGPALAAYAAAGVRNDHECSSAAEASERLALGLAVMLREGSAARNLLHLLPAVTPDTAPFCFMATDDRHPEDLLGQGSINHLVRLAVKDGRLNLSAILKLATLNGPRHFGLTELGAVAPGYRADLALFPDLENFRPARVWKDGRLAAENGRCLYEAGAVDEGKIRAGLKLGPISLDSFKIPARGPHVRVMGLIPGELTTEHLILSPAAVDGCYVAEPEADLVKAAVFERYKGDGRHGLGFLKGLGLKKGALASTVAHDSHNLVVAGANDADMLAAAEEIRRIGGGLAVVENKQVLGSLPLPLGGLMSDRPMEEIRAKLARMQEAARGLGLREGHDPFMTLAFMSLPVIPKLKLTEAGLVDVEKFAVVPLTF